MPALSILLWLPAAFGLLAALVSVLFHRRGMAGASRPEMWAPDSAWSSWGLSVSGAIALFGSLAALGLAIAYIADYSPAHVGLQHVTDVVWISELGIHYKLGVDGLNVFLLGLTTLLFAAATLAANLRSWDRPRLFFFHLMLAESAVLGAFLAQDLALFVAFFDLMLIPFYFLIGGWGKEPERVKATIKLVIYTLVGSLLMLAAAIATGVLASQRGGGHITFVLSTLQGLPLSRGSQEWIFLFFAAAFLVKMPAFPLHGWMPDGYRAMPIEVLMVFSGVLSKVGAYGFLRIVLPLYPQAAAHFQTLMLLIALASILYGSLLAFTHTDARLIVGYSSMAQLGFITLGIFSLNPQGAQGALLQMVNHGLVVAPILFIIALLAQRAGGSEDIRDMGGIAVRAPILARPLLDRGARHAGDAGLIELRRRVPHPARHLQSEAGDRRDRLHGGPHGERLRAAAVHPHDAQPRRPPRGLARDHAAGRRRAGATGRRNRVPRDLSAAGAAPQRRLGEGGGGLRAGLRKAAPEDRRRWRLADPRARSAHQLRRALGAGGRGAAMRILATAHLKGPHVDFAGLSPLIALLGGAVLVLLIGLLGSRRVRAQAVPTLSLAALGTALGLTIWQWNAQKSIVSGALRIDDLALVLNLLLIGGGACAILLAWRSLAAREAGHGEFHALLLSSLGGMSLLVSAENTVAVFLAFELLSIPLYVLCASELKREHSLESGLKYLIIGSVGSATLLYGLAMIYGATGATDFGAIARGLARGAWRATR